MVTVVLLSLLHSLFGIIEDCLVGKFDLLLDNDHFLPELVVEVEVECCRMEYPEQRLV